MSSVSLTTWYYTGLDDDEYRAFIRARSMIGAGQYGALTRQLDVRVAPSSPELPAAAARPATTPRVAPPEATVEVPLVDVELREDTEPSLRVHLSKTARARISEACSEYDRLEVGGWLVGQYIHREGATYVSTAAEASDQNRANTVALRIDWFDADAARIAKYGGAHNKLVGSWHSHPNGMNTPSTIDMGVYSRLLTRSGQARYIGLIVAPHRRWRDWSNPLITAWITQRDKHDRYVCTRADLT